MLLIIGCSSSREAQVSEPPGFTASLYNPSRLSLHPDFLIFHESAGYSVLFIRAYPAELRFSEANEDAEYRAMLALRYQLIHLNDPAGEGVVIDSASVTYRLSARDENKPAFFASLNIPVEQGENYLLRLETEDLNRGSKGLEYLHVDKTSPWGAQNFKVVSNFSGYPKFMRFFIPGESFDVNYRDPSVDSVKLSYFLMESELPRPPITASADYTLNYTPDTSYMAALKDTSSYDLSREGMYLMRVDERFDQGLTLFNFGESFPQVKSPDELMEPLFYLATLAEYRDLRRESNRKLAVDNFWLGLGNNLERSRELIRIYYNRVVYSNLYFTTNKEGWKTDRGMIFILLGPPSRIQMTGNGERWYYLARRRGRAVEFRFDRQPDVFSNQHMVWVQTTDSRMYWNEAVRVWRSGKVYSMGS